MSEQLILASASPRRKALLESIGLAVEVIPADIDETVKVSEGGRELVSRLSMEKADKIAQSYPSRVVLAADTTVSLDGELLGKPQNASEAEGMLRSLSGEEHSVFTGFTVCQNSERVFFTQAVETKVLFRELADDEISSYTKSGEPFGLAGGYAIQGKAQVFIERIEGSYSNVVGLPLCEVAQVLKNFSSWSARNLIS